MMPMSTISSANATFAGQNFGAGRSDRIRKALRQVIGLQLLWSLIAVALAFGTGRFLVRMLIGTEDSLVINNAVLNLRVCTLFFFPLGILVALRNVMQPMGYKIAPVVSSGIELTFKVVFAATVIPRAGYPGVVITEPVIWVVCAVFLGIVFLMHQNSWKRKADTGGSSEKNGQE